MGFAPLPTCYDTLSPLFHAQYALVEEIGVGGSGFVLKVQRRSNGEFFAAKVIAKDRVSRQTLVRTRSWGSVPPGFELDEQDALVVPAEAYVLRKMRHPGVCGFIDLFADDLFFYLVRSHRFSYLPGEADRVDIRRFSSITAPPSRRPTRLNLCFLPPRLSLRCLPACLLRQLHRARAQLSLRRLFLLSPALLLRSFPPPPRSRLQTLRHRR